MSISGRLVQKKLRDPKEAANTVSSETSKDGKNANNAGRKPYNDVQSAARFPVKLPIA
jgi:hypothetical protein